MGAERVANVKRFLAKYRSAGDAPGEQAYVDTYTRRLRNHNRFMKLLVDQFTEERIRSVGLVALAQRVQAQLVGDLGRVHRVGQVLLVGKHQQHRVA